MDDLPDDGFSLRARNEENTAEQQHIPHFTSGEEIGKYTLHEVIDQGSGSTFVYTASHRDRKDEEALKLIAEFGDGDRLFQKLHHEFKVLKKITNLTNILRIHPPEKEMKDGLSCVLLPMEKAQSSLRGWLNDTNTDRNQRLREGLELFYQACLGVQTLHDTDIIHYDIKPSNLLLFAKGGSSSPPPTLKVADFGLARSMKEAEHSTSSMGLKEIGTPAYMPPEQVDPNRIEDITPAADIYSLGVILYELLDGSRPFAGSPADLMRKHQEKAPSPVRGDAPEYLRNLALQCLNKDPDKRPQSAKELAELVQTDPEEEKAFNEAIRQNSVEAFRTFLSNFPNGSKKEETNKQLAHLEQERKRKEEEYRRKMEEVYKNCTASNTIHCWKQFLQSYPDSPYNATVHEGITMLEEKQRQEQVRQQKAREDQLKSAWEEKRKELERSCREEIDLRKEDEAKRLLERYRQHLLKHPTPEPFWHPEDDRIHLELKGLIESSFKKPFIEPVTGMEFVWVPGGSFMMGNIWDDHRGLPEEYPVHTVVLKGFYIGKYPVTQQQYEMVMGNNPSDRKYGDLFPVECVSYRNIIEFIDKLSAITGKPFSLPSEAQWEYAARGGRDHRWFGTSVESEIEKFVYYDEKPTTLDELSFQIESDTNNRGKKPAIARVDQHLANSFGLHDMQGNVNEYCEDRWHDNYSGAPTDGSPWMRGGSRERVTRGSFWGISARSFPICTRGKIEPDLHPRGYGFRLVGYQS